MQSAQHSVSVSAVIVDDTGRVLVVRRRDNGKWEPPGGVLELAETIPDGLAREVAEETGMRIRIGPLTGVYKNMSHGIVALVFRCTAVSGDLGTNDEVAEFRWMPLHEVQQELDEAYAVRISDALTTQATAIRAHDGYRLTVGSAARTQ